MNTQKAVYNGLFSKKTELKTHKIELGIIDGVERGVNKIYGDIDRARATLSGASNEAESISKNILLKVESALETINKAEEMANDLGVKIPKIAEQKKRLSKAEKNGKELLKAASAAGKFKVY